MKTCFVGNNKCKNSKSKHDLKEEAGNYIDKDELQIYIFLTLTVNILEYTTKQETLLCCHYTSLKVCSVNLNKADKQDV